MTQNTKTVEIDAHDLPLHCPTNKSPAWSSHPRVFLDISHGGKATCPYCSTTYQLKAGVELKGHH